MENILLVFVKYPEAGNVKTRLSQGLGEAPAAELYKGFVELTLDQTVSSRWRRRIMYSPVERAVDMMKWLGHEPELQPQVGNDLGSRLIHAFTCALLDGYKKIVCIGTDCPQLTVDDIQAAFDALGRAPCVIGPAHDGGYYLIGMSRPLLDIFRDISWSTPEVLGETLQNAHAVGVQPQLLPERRDIDTMDDLRWLLHEPALPDKIAAFRDTILKDTFGTA